MSPVVVGVDCSAESLQAVAVAAEEARRRDVPLRIVHARARPGAHFAGDDLDNLAGGRFTAVLRRGASVAAQVCSGLQVHTDLVDGRHTAVLLAEAQSAELLVVGHRGLGSLTGLLTGAVGLQLAGRTACPLLIVRGEACSAGQVVVGVDDASRSRALLEAAFEQAQRAGRPLKVVHIREIPRPELFRCAVFGHDLDAEERYEWGEMRTAVDAIAARHPDVPVSVELIWGRPVAALMGAAEGASMLVIGARGAGGFRGMVLGSVAMAATQHSPCPVVVVPSHRWADVGSATST
jgi:nucleotide-binding universal stress UspA family protein